MTRNPNDTDAESTDDRTTAAETDEERLERSADGGDDSAVGTRRGFLKASAGAAAGAALLGGSSLAAGQTVVEETCESFGELAVGGGDFLLINNDWGASVDDFEMCSWRRDDGSYGYHWETRPTGGEPNYPQVLLGTKPWGDDSEVASFPIQRGDVDEFVLEIDVDLDVSGGEWNLAEEWWLMEQPPSVEAETHTHEIMLVLEWSDEHSHGGVREEDAWTDRFGNTIDYWTYYEEGGGTAAGFHIFRVSGGLTSGRVDLAEIIDFMSERHGVGADPWISGVEVGNEYWEGVRGEVTYETLDVTINGTTYTSGSDGGSSGSGDDGDGDDNDGDGDGDDDGDDGTSDDLNAELNPSTTAVSVGEQVTFDVTDTTGDATWIDSLEWEFGDGTTASGWWNAHSYDAAGTYTVALHATDNEGVTTTHEVEITVS